MGSMTARPFAEGARRPPGYAASASEVGEEALSDAVAPPANTDAAAGKPLLAFVHIPRTGGGTVSTAIARNYSPRKDVGNYQRNPAKPRQGLKNVVSRDEWKAIGGHVPFGLFRRYLSADTHYITVLRDPVDRVLSHYYFHAQAGDPPGSLGPRKLRNTWETLLNHERLEREGGDQEAEIVLEDVAEFTLEEGLRRKICIYDNFMTRFLWGGESLYGDLPPGALERAKENLSTFWVVGVRERLDESIVLLGRKLGVGLMPYYLRHVSQKRPPLDETSDELRALIAEHNPLDVELYRFARELSKPRPLRRGSSTRRWRSFALGASR
jgi:Sulfotransferase domain